MHTDFTTCYNNTCLEDENISQWNLLISLITVPMQRIAGYELHRLYQYYNMTTYKLYPRVIANEFLWIP
jgi:hypothetical protein